MAAHRLSWMLERVGWQAACNGVSVTITGAVFYSHGGAQFQVMWWDSGTRRSEWVDTWEVTIEHGHVEGRT